MKYKNYEIKNVTHVQAMTRETNCFSLTLYVDGKKFAEVSNNGHGGSDNIYPVSPYTQRDIDRVEEEMSNDDFLVSCEFEKFESAVSTLLLLHYTEKELKKLSKTNVAILDDGVVKYFGYKGSKEAPSEELFAQVEKDYPDAIILNKMDIREAAVMVVKADREKNAKNDEELPAPGM